MKWNEESANRWMSIFRIVASVGVIVLGILSLTDVWPRAMDVAAPLAIALLAVQAMQEWKRSRAVAIVSLVVAIFFLVCIVIIWCLR